MRKHTHLILVIGMFIVSTFSVCRFISVCQSAFSATVVDNWRLIDHLGKGHELYHYVNSKAVVLVSHQLEGGLSHDELKLLKELLIDWEMQGVKVIVLNTDIRSDRNKIAKQVDDLFPIVLDESQIVSRGLGISHVGEVIILNPKNWTIVYRGALELDSDYQRGYKIKSIGILNALNQLLTTGEIHEPWTSANRIRIRYHYHTKRHRISYSPDITTIVEKHCVGCHSVGGVAPFSLEKYADIRSWAAMIREVVITKRMPPWFADPHYGPFINDKSLSPEDAAKLVTWIDNGARRGIGEDLLEKNSKTILVQSKWPLGEPDVVFNLVKQEIPAFGNIPFKIIEVDNKLTKDVWVTSAAMLPSNPRVLHHAWVFAQATYESTGSNRLSKNDSSNYYNNSIAGYVPGFNLKYSATSRDLLRTNPIKVGSFLPAKSKLIFVLHYTSTGKEEEDYPSLGLYLADENEHFLQRHIVAAMSVDFVIPAGVSEFPVEGEVKLNDDMLLFGFVPHMHYRGKYMRYDAIYPNGNKETLFSLPFYNFNWQLFYGLSNPKLLPKGTVVRCIGAFDNSPLNSLNPNPSTHVEYGVLSENEMFECIMVGALK